MSTKYLGFFVSDFACECYKPCIFVQVKSQELFDEWVAKLRHHRMYRQNEISMFPHDVNNLFFPVSTTTDSVPGFCDSAPGRKVIVVIYK